MRKLIMCFLMAVVLFAACDKSEEGNGSGKKTKLLVDKAYNHYNNQIAEYIYDANNSLIKAEYTDGDGLLKEFSFEYEDGKVIELAYRNCRISDESYSLKMTYDSKGRIVKTEQYDKQGEFQMSTVYSYSSDGQVKALLEDDGTERSFLSYDENKNAIQYKLAYYLYKQSSEEFLQTNKYDSKNKPSFGVDYLFVVDLLPYSSISTTIAERLSNNNIIDSRGTINGEYTLNYTYNEEGLPVSIEVNNHLMEMLGIEEIKLSYKEIK